MGCNEMDYPVVGVTFEGRQDILNRFYGRYAYGKKYGVRLFKEDDNQYDSNAVGVELETSPNVYEMVGYIPKDRNCELRAEWGRMKEASLRSIGPTRGNNIGLTISVKFENRRA